MAFDAAKPAEGILAKSLNDEIRVNNVGLEAALTAGHDFSSGGTQTGIHNQGSAVIYSGASAPTTQEDGSTALAAADVNRRLWLDTSGTPDVLNVLTAIGPVTWTPLTQLIGMLDEDDMSSDSAILTASQQSIKKYIDDQVALQLALAGGTMTGALNMGSNLVNAVTDPSAAQDAATKNYVDTQLAANIETDTYTGDGTATDLVRHTFGFNPVLVIIVSKEDNAGATRSPVFVFGPTGAVSNRRGNGNDVGTDDVYLNSAELKTKTTDADVNKSAVVYQITAFG